MKLPGRNQWIVIVGGLSVLAAGLYAVSQLPIANAQAFLDFAGPFGWKVIVGAVGAAGTVKGAGAIAKAIKAKNGVAE